MAGFAVSEYLPVEAITGAPHFGYAITIDLADVVAEVPSSGNTPDPSGEIPGSRGSGKFPGDPAFMPEGSTLDQPADAHGEASVDSAEFADGSSLVFFRDAGGCDDVTVRGGIDNGAQSKVVEAAVGLGSAKGAGSDVCGDGRRVGNGKGAQTEVYAAGVGAAVSGGGRICFDSVDSGLEAAVLRHVTQLATLPVIVDRPGGRVRSERELRLVVPLARNVRGEWCMDEAAAVAVELGVLRGLLDLFSGSAGGSESDGTIGRSGARGLGAGTGGASLESGGGRDGSRANWKKKWWRFGCFLVWMGVVACSVTGTAAPRGRLGKGAQTEVYATRSGSGLAVAPRPMLAGVPAVVAMPGPLVADLAEPEPLPAQGQFAMGGPTKISDGTNTLVVDPCKGQTRLFVSINQTANTQLVAGTSSRKIYICSIHVVVAAATSVALVEGTGSVCGTGTAGVSGFGGATAATGWNFAANGGIAYGNGEAAVGADGTAADNLCLFNSGSGQVSGGIGYVVQ